LPAEINISPFEMFVPGAEWREWCVPADIINQYGKVRQLPEDERARAKHQWEFECIVKAREELTAAGLLAIARDANGQPIYRNGQIVYRITEKGIKLAKELEDNSDAP
jgi:hypothetical protein